MSLVRPERKVEAFGQSKGSMNNQEIEFEVKNIKRRIKVDDKRLNYNKMSDTDLSNQCGRDYSFKFMDTAADKEYLKHVMINRLAQARKQKANA